MQEKDIRDKLLQRDEKAHTLLMKYLHETAGIVNSNAADEKKKDNDNDDEFASDWKGYYNEDEEQKRRFNERSGTINEKLT